MLKNFEVMFVELSDIEVAGSGVPGVPTGAFYVPACRMGTNYDLISQSWMLEFAARYEKDNKVRTLVNFEWNRQDATNDRSKIDAILDKGFYVGNRLYARVNRTASQGRAGGAWMSTMPEFYRSVQSNGLDGNVDAVVSKWEAYLGLNYTTSIGLDLGNINIQVIPDLERMVSTNVLTLETGENVPNPLGLEALQGIVYEVLSDKTSKKIGNPDIQYKLVSGKKDIKLTLSDGNGIASFAFFEKMATAMQMTIDEKEEFTLAQFRAPAAFKGTITKFDIAGYCDENGITELTNIYGEKFDPRKCDVIVYESCWKWASYFKSMHELKRFWNSSIPVSRSCTQFKYRVQHVNLINVLTKAIKHPVMPTFYPRKRKLGKCGFKSPLVTYVEDMKVFPTPFRIANFTKAHEKLHKLTYQYLQALQKLDVNSLIQYTSPLYQAIENASTDIDCAKALLGMVSKGESDAGSLVSKAAELLELSPELFKTKFIQRRILNTVDKLVLDQKRGNVLTYGGYYFLAPDPTLTFCQPGLTVKDGRVSNRVLGENEQAGILHHGESYCPEMSGSVTLGFRSPLIHMSEVARFEMSDRSELNKWLGHLRGVVVFNGYDTTALGMGGADYDGDKAYFLNPYEALNRDLINAYEPNQPLIVSPLEFLTAKKTAVTKESIHKFDLLTLDNYTGVYTNMGTFYINKLYHVKKVFSDLLKSMSNTQEWWNRFYTIIPLNKIPKNPIYNVNVLTDIINSVCSAAIGECNYNLTCIRIAQAGEIDFTKHGIRFALPLSCETQCFPMWLKDYTMPFGRKGVTCQYAEYGMIMYCWQEMSLNGKPIDKCLYYMESPMQKLSDSVDAYYESYKKSISEISSSDTMGIILGADFNYNAYPTLGVMYPQVEAICKAFGQEVAQVKQYGKVSADVLNALYGKVYDKYISISKQFADREAFAVCCLYYETQTKCDSSPTFILGYDGLIEILLKRDTVIPRIARIDLPDWISTVFIEESHKAYACRRMILVPCVLPVGISRITVLNGYTTIGCDGQIKNIAVPIADGEYTCCPDGVYVPFKEYFRLPKKFNFLAAGQYNIKDLFGKKYICFNVEMSEAEKVAFREEHYKRVTPLSVDGNKEYQIEAVTGLRLKFTITGMNRVQEPTDTVEVASLIKEYRGQALIVEGKRDDGIPAPMVKIGNRIVGMISTRDIVHISKNGVINYRQFYGKVIRISVDGAIYKNKKGTLEPLKSMNVLAKVETSNSVGNVTLDKFHSRCDLSKWYWNTKWYTFNQLGCTLTNIQYNVGCFAMVSLKDVDGNLIDININVDKTIGLFASGLSINGVEADLSQLTNEVYATAYRAAAYLYSRSMK